MKAAAKMVTFWHDRKIGHVSNSTVERFLLLAIID